MANNSISYLLFFLGRSLVKLMDNEAIQAKATKLLHQAGVAAWPVDLKPVLSYLGVALNETPLEKEYSGFLAVKEKTIVVNDRHSPERRRFTIAHEIGHYQLHRKRNSPIVAFIDEVVFHNRDNHQDDIPFEMEMEANCYAFGLLMGENLIDAWLKKNETLDLEKPSDLKILAADFGVSRRAMEYRLKVLGIGLRTNL